TGESGTGKEVIARLVHTYSGRRGPFVAVNCAALVETLLESELFGHERGAFTGAHAAKPGKFEQAAEGTLFLDEVGELPPTVQAKLLRVLQEGAFERVGGTRTLETHARIVAATNRDLLAEVAAGRFREDLLYRLAVVTLHVPPLRERREDILPLARHLLARACRRLDRSAVTLAPDAEAWLRARDWPGNVRELDNVLARALVHVRGPRLTADMLDGPIAAPPGGATATDAFRDANGRLYSLDELEAIQIANALRETGGHKGRVCAILGISRPALERKLDRYGLRPPARRGLGDHGQSVAHSLEQRRGVGSDAPHRRPHGRGDDLINGIDADRDSGAVRAGQGSGPAPRGAILHAPFRRRRCNEGTHILTLAMIHETETLPTSDHQGFARPPLFYG
ncbi:MAG: sigma-54-dependent Fis family transcriptional regulator, partial [Candidatus Contendobacter sp.]